MANLPEVQDELVVSRAPTTAVSPSQVASPYMLLADNLNKGAEALDKIAEPLAEQAGFQAVSTDQNGKIQVQQAPIVGPAAAAYSRGVKMGALAEGEGAARRADIAMRQQYRDDPQGYLTAADGFKKQMVADYTKSAGPEVGFAMSRAIDGATTLTYRGLLNEKERLDLARADKSMEAQMQSLKDDAFAMARAGDTSSDHFKQTMQGIQTLTNERTQNPRLAYPKEQADYDMQHLYGELSANGFLHHIDEVYNSPKGDADTRAQGALDAAKSVLTDQSLKLTQPQREQYYHKAVAEVRANEALRKQSVWEARQAFTELSMASQLGLKIAPEDVDKVANAFIKSGSPADAARVYAQFARKPLNDDFGRQPLSDQTTQLNQLRGVASIRTNNPGAQWPGPVATQFGAVGSEDVAGGNKIAVFPTPIHGAAAQFGLLDKNYTGMTLSSAITKWSGGNSSPQYVAAASRATGLSPDTVITPELLRGPQGVALAKAMATVEAGRAYPMTDAQWQQAQEVAFKKGQMPEVPADQNPATSLWLQQNRARTLQTGARQAWTTIMKDWTADKVRPNDDVVHQVLDAARATNDHDLLETMGADLNRIQTVQEQGRASLPEQQANIELLTERSAAGELAPGQQAILKDLNARREAVTKGLNENPVGTTTANFPERFQTPAPLDLSNDQNLIAGLRYRQNIAQFATRNWQVTPRSALDTSDIEQIKGALTNASPQDKMRVFGALTAGLTDENTRNATLAKLGKDSPQLMVAAAAGSLAAQAPGVAESILRGQDAIKADKGYLPTGTEAAALRDELDKHLPAGAFSLAARTTDNGPLEVAQNMIKARYADLSAQAADTSGKLNKDRLTQATDDVTGGVLSHNGGPLIAPTRGMSQMDFDRTMQGMTDNDLAGVTTPDGKPVTANDLRDQATLESHASGRYMVKFGSNTYAYRNADTESPQKFVLDLRNRPMGNWTPSYLSMVAGALAQ